MSSPAKSELEKRLESILTAINATEEEVSSGRLVYETVGKQSEDPWPTDMAKPCGGKKPRKEDEQ